MTRKSEKRVGFRNDMFFCLMDMIVLSYILEDSSKTKEQSNCYYSKRR